MCGGCTGPENCDDTLGHLPKAAPQEDLVVTEAQARADLDDELEAEVESGLMDDAEAASTQVDAEIFLAIGGDPNDLEASVQEMKSQRLSQLGS